jgi:hypothetical protein
MTLIQWLQQNAFLILLFLYVGYLLMRPPSISGWLAFLDSFQNKGAQLLLLWISNVLVIVVLVRFWALFDAQLKTTIVGILSAVNGAFLGAVGAHALGSGNGNGKPADPDALGVSFAPGEKK